MSALKVGDRVRIDCPSCTAHGLDGVVSKVSSDGVVFPIEVKVDREPGLSADYRFFDAKELHLLEDGS